MIEDLRYCRWTCDDCGKQIIIPAHNYPEGWNEVSDNTEGEC